MKTSSNLVSFVAAAGIMLIAILLYDVMGAIIKHLSQDYPSQQLALFRNLFGLVPTLTILACSQNWKEAGRPIVIRQWKLALARGGIGVLAQLSFYTSLLHLELATASTILFAGPLFVTALSIPLLGHHVGLWRWLAVIIGFTGVVMVMRPAGDSFSWYAVLPLCAAFGYATVGVTSPLFDRTVPTALIKIYYSAGALIGAIILVVVTDGLVPIRTPADWAWLAAMGIAGGTAAYCLTSAYRLADPSSLSPFEYFGIPSSFLLGWLFFAEAPFDRLLPGVFLIVGGGLLIIWREHLQKRRKAAGPSEA